jgi:hypothetical protein
MTRRIVGGAEGRRREKEKKSGERMRNTRDAKKMVIIACEDTKSSRFYFEAIFKELRKSRALAKASLVIAEHIGTQPSKVLEAR